MEAMHLVCKICTPVDTEGNYGALTKDNSLKLSDWMPAAGYTLMAPFPEDRVERADKLEEFFAAHRHMEDKPEALRHNFDILYESESG